MIRKWFTTKETLKRQEKEAIRHENRKAENKAPRTELNRILVDDMLITAVL